MMVSVRSRGVRAEGGLAGSDTTGIPAMIEESDRRRHKDSVPPGGDTEVFKCASRNTRRRRDGDSLLEEISEIIGLQVYTQNGVFLGNVNNLVVDVDNGAVDGIFVGETNPLLVEGSRAVSVPYRWVQSVGDIVILRHFPKRVTTRKAPAAVPAVK